VNLTGARWVAVAGVAALTIVVVVLAALALQRSRGEGDAAANPVPSFTLGVTTPTPTPTAEASPGAQTNRAEERFLTAGSEVMWRGVAGECGVTEPLIERSVDGGGTWTDVTPRYLGIGQIMGMNAFSPIDAEVIAAVGPACEVQALRTYTDGEFWEPYPEVLAAAAYLDTIDSTILVSAEERLPPPCPTAQGLRTSGDVAALICDGSVWLRIGEEWVVSAVNDVSALYIAAPEVWVAFRDKSCEGLAVSRVMATPESNARPIGCVEGADPAAAAALTVLNGTALLWAGDGIVSLTGIP
jgi:hypothetical protein